MRPSDSPRTVAAIIERLGDAGLPCLLFGGWAEEALGLCMPRAHEDLDLLLPAPSFRELDRLLESADDLEEIPLKRFAHKRAFLRDGLLVEVLLAQQEGASACTWFWGERRFAWLHPLSEPGRLSGIALPCVSGANLQRFRRLYRSIEPWRWREPRSLVAPEV